MKLKHNLVIKLKLIKLGFNRIKFYEIMLKF